jgi:hypothetical protein
MMRCLAAIGAAVMILSGFGNLVAAENEGSDSASAVRPVNIDMSIVYGQYNTMFSTINLAQDAQDFVYLLSSSFKRSNDYGYDNTTFENSSYLENKIGFTGNLNVTQSMKTILDVGVDFASHGMFANPDFSREEKDRIDIGLKNIHKMTPQLELYYVLGWANYSHQLIAGRDSGSVRTRLSKYSGELGWEYIWSAANRIRGKSYYTMYGYTTGESDYDFVKGELIDDFNITSFLALSIGLNFAWHRDFGFLGSEDYTGKTLPSGYQVPFAPIAGFAIRGEKVIGLVAEYRYDLTPFKPEEYYFASKYIYPVYGLPPSRSHRGDCRIDIRPADPVNFKLNGTIASYDQYHNYAPVAISGNEESALIAARTTEAVLGDFSAEASVSMLDQTVSLSAGYEYHFTDSGENITYRPESEMLLTLRYTGTQFNAAWENSYKGRVYVDPESDRTLDPALVGSLELQYKAAGNLYANLRIENVYNSRYFMREGYQESGLAGLFGLRILL